MHVVHVVRQYYPAIGGLEEAVGQLAATLAGEPGVRCTVVTLDRRFADRATPLPADDAHAGVPIRRVPFTGSTRYPLAPRVLGAIRDADIVHVHGIDFFFDFLALTRVVHRKPLVASTHGGFFHTAFASRAKALWFQTITRASAHIYERLFGSSVQDAERFATIAPGRTVALENGVNIAKWHNAASATPAPVMLFVGRFSQNKGLPVLLRVLATLAPKWRLIVAGQESDFTAADLVAEATALGVAARLELVVAPDAAALRALVSRASFLVSAASYEGFGLTAVEGLSAGLVPVLNAIPPFRRLVDTTGRGYVVAMADASAAAATLDHALAALTDDPRATRAANVAAAAGYGWPGVAARFLAEYCRVLAAS